MEDEGQVLDIKQDAQPPRRCRYNMSESIIPGLVFLASTTAATVFFIDLISMFRGRSGSSPPKNPGKNQQDNKQQSLLSNIHSLGVVY